MRARIVMASVAFWVVCTTPGSAQRTTCPASGSAVARPCELDQWPLAERGPLKPRYPDILRQAGVSGEVHLRYVVDTTGRPRLDSISVLRSTHQLFTNAVKSALSQQRFEQPRRASLPTNVEVEELVTFAHQGPAWKSSRDPVIRRGVDSTDRLTTTVFAFTPRDSIKAPTLTSADSVRIHSLAIEELMRTRVMFEAPPVAWCVQLHGRAPSADLLKQWSGQGKRVVAIADCPRTYTSMVHTPDAPKPPRGWVDPVQIAIDSIIPWSEDTVILESRTGQGTVSRVQRCEVILTAGKWSHAFCVETEFRIS